MNAPTAPPPSTGPRPTGLSRRGFLGGGGAILLLAACGTEGTSQTAGTAVKDLSAKQKVLNFSNWPLYIDTNENGAHPTLKAFEQKTGIKVNYVEEINDNASFFAKIRPQLAAGEPTGSDIVVFTDDYAGHMIQLGWTQKLDKSNIPNAKNLASSLASPPFDPNRTHSIPWQSGLTGIGVNTKVTGRDVGTMEDLLTARDLRGKVTLLSEMGDTMGLIMLDMGINPTDFSQSEYDRALGKLQKAVDAGQIRQFTGNDYAPQLAKGNIAAAVAWSGDIIQLQFEDPKIQYVVPEAGQMLWSDNLQVPILATHKTNAEKLMNYYYDPEVAAKVAAWVNYICPVEGAQEEMKKIDPSLAKNELIFPTGDMLAKSHPFMSMPWDKLEGLREQYSQVIGL